MPWSIEERRAWLFPPMSGVVDGIDLALLDPSDPDDRHLLLVFEHSEYDFEADEVVVNGETVSPHLHVSFHEIVANQIWDGEPEVTWQTAERLTADGYDRHEVLHMIAAVVGDEVWHSMREQRLHDPESMAKGLAALPESWEAERVRSAEENNHRNRPRRRRH